ncbi:hypothetical protein Q7P37_008250 [Cladosporium fusiforme]
MSALLAYFLCAAAALAAAVPSLDARQENPNSTCLVYGIDFVQGGSYFINSNSTANFTTVQQFDDCNDDSASILLVQQSTEDEWECSSVETVPSNTSQLSTCPLEKDQMSSGEWTILVIGNNGDGNPFAYERDFTLTVGQQTTITVTPTVTYTQSSTPLANTTITSQLDYTSTLNNTLTITSPAETDYITVVPAEVTTTETRTIWHSHTSWTQTQSVIHETATPSCTIPSRPSSPDPWATFKPTIIPLPAGLHWKRSEARAVDPEEALARLLRHRARKVSAISPDKKIKNRSADAPRITATASPAVNSTVTSIFPTSTATFTIFSSKTTYTTLPPQTVRSETEYDTITAPTPTDTIYTAVWSRTVITSTLSLDWTLTHTSTPSALATSCMAQGGHFGFGGWFD